MNDVRPARDVVYELITECAATLERLHAQATAE
jgi:hypothetical protein